MRVKCILFILLLVTITYTNSLFNDFVGDDSVLFVSNTFYKSWDNLHRLFERGYAFDSSKVDIKSQTDFGSGSVAYRPVDNLTYFIDYWLWGMKPFGFHLTNLLLHLCNVVLVFLLLLRLGVSTYVGCFVALLFGLHPVLSEAVCAIGYRADLLAAFFVLLSFYTWIIYTQHQRMLMYSLSLLFFFLAVFSKESAIVLPVFILAYEGIAGRRSWVRQSFFWLIMMFYLYVYLFVFPSPELHVKRLLGQDILEHVHVMLKIFVTYIQMLLCPWQTHPIPSLYIPTLHKNLAETLQIIFLMIGLMSIVLFFKKRNKIIFLMFLWFLVFYIPISNLVSIPSPIALRFMYLPSIGFICAVAILLHQSIGMISKRFLNFFIMFILIICMFSTILLNTIWKSLPDVMLTWSKYYTDSWKADLMMGRLYHKNKDYKKALEYYFQSILKEARVQDVRIDYYTALSLLELGQKDRAQRHLEFVIHAWPTFSRASYVLGGLHRERKDFEKAIKYYVIAASYDPKSVGYYVPLIDMYTQLGEKENITELLNIAKDFLTPEEFHSLENRSLL